ncbi:unnamed protein product [Anisakis simplex]|uniref:Angiotensin-converting enzyme n=1 Tax=Anisakis simplex TaxID=6269 RepID=A0A0M3JTX8_ANISI|nr:unnamed protein product [Anisakis simplex]
MFLQRILVVIFTIIIIQCFTLQTNSNDLRRRRSETDETPFISQPDLTAAAAIAHDHPKSENEPTPEPEPLLATELSRAATTVESALRSSFSYSPPESTISQPSESATPSLPLAIQPEPTRPQLESDPASSPSVAISAPAYAADSSKMLSDDALEQISAEDYGDITESVSIRFDNDVIQQLVDRFLNTGNTEDEKETKVNKAAQSLPEHSIKDPALAKKWMDGYSVEAQKVLYQVTTAGWSYVTSVSHLTKQLFDEADQVEKKLSFFEVLSEFVKATSKQAKQFDLSVIEDPILRKQFEILSIDGVNALDDASLQEYSDIQAAINKKITDAAICELDHSPPCVLKHADLPSILAREKNAKNAKHIWLMWRATISPQLAPSYERLMELTNQGATLNGFSNGGAMWRSPYDLSIESGRPKLNMLDEMNRLFDQILPFYKQLHAYVRRQLTGVFGIENTVELSKDGPIPAHLLKSLIGDDWTALYYDTRPFESDDTRSEEINANLHRLNYTSKAMFIQAYKYFKQLGFGKLPHTLWTKSVFSRTWSKDMVCNPAVAYDMRDVNANDYRIKACVQPNENDFKRAHKLMAHLYYEYLYREQPFPLREAANPSTLMALINAFANLATNIDYLKSLAMLCYLDFVVYGPPLWFLLFSCEEHEVDIIKLLPTGASNGHAAQVNMLYLEALEQFVKLPYDLVVDVWRFNIFDGKTTKETWNDDWWKLREHYQGLKGPSHQATDFDAIVSPAISQKHSPAIRHFVSYIMQFQFMKALCNNKTTNLNEGCRLQKSAVANVKRVMMAGSSINWMDALKMITGSEQLDAKPLLEYYEPLISWLGNANEHDQVVVGWDGVGTPFSEYDLISIRFILPWLFLNYAAKLERAKMKILKKDPKILFFRSEVPVARTNTSNADLHQVLSEDQVAFPGGDCSKGQECLLDSTCKNGLCECNEGLFTLKIANTYNCVPGNPADAGFGGGHGGLVIGLYPEEGDGDKMTTPEPSAEPEPTASAKPVQASNPKSKSAVGTCFSSTLIGVCLTAFVYVRLLTRHA